MNIRTFFKGFALAAVSITLLTACPDGDDPKDDNGDGKGTLPGLPPIATLNGKNFSIPSPLQLSLLIKQTGASYNAAILNKNDKVDQYTTQYSKALNLGIYGADLGYTSIYDHSDDALKYMKSVKKLSDGLGLSQAFDKATLERIQKNVTNRDSLLFLVSSTYRDCDHYLKNNHMEDVGALIVTGGWIESMYLAVNSAGKKPHADVLKRIAEQKLSIDNLIEMLSLHGGAQEDVSVVTNKLSEIKELYDQVTFVYKYIPPVTDKANKITTIKSTSTPQMSDEIYKSITEKIIALRNTIVQN